VPLKWAGGIFFWGPAPHFAVFTLKVCV